MEPDQHDVVAAALVRDGRALLCHRHPARQWYPNVWDLPGGHLSPGETPAAALRRELDEELGIRIRLQQSDSFELLQPSPDLRLHLCVVTDWAGEIQNRASDEHDDLAWFAANQIRDLDLAEHELADILINAIGPNTAPTGHDPQPTSHVRQHLTAVLAEHDVSAVAGLRHKWDPVMATGVPPHITIAYPEEVSDFELLLERARRLLPQIPAFQVGLGSATALDDGASGVFVEVADESGSMTSIRHALLAHPLEQREFRPHLTVVHPRTSIAGHRCWQQLKHWRAGGEVRISEIAFTHTSVAHGMHVQETFPLR